jgi:hypothetical protein
MIGYPKNTQLTKVDYENLLSMPEHAGKAAKDLKALAEVDDSKITVDEGTSEKPNLKQIDNPLPTWKKAGFRSKVEMLTIAKAELKPVEEPIEEPIEESVLKAAVNTNQRKNRYTSTL